MSMQANIAIEHELRWLLGYIENLEKAGTHPAQIVEYVKTDLKDKIKVAKDGYL